MKNNQPKVLVVSHNVFAKDTNMGKTLASYFSAFDRENLAQFYIHSEIPTSNICCNYYRITDSDAIKSIFTRRSGNSFSINDIEEERATSRIDSGVSSRLYQKARNRTPLIYFFRNAWWFFSGWYTKKFEEWIDSFNPDIVFLASGDYSFIYRIALRIAKKRKIPLVISCMDDYYFNNKNSNRFGGKFVHNLFMKQVEKTVAYSTCIFSICDTMATDYAKLFNKKNYVLHTAASFSEALSGEKQNKISYVGNLGYGRNEQLIKLGKALKECTSKTAPKFIDVYSAEARKEILKDFSEKNGIVFHGSVPAEEVKKIIVESKVVVHIESFEKEYINSVKYSVSTKIPDSLMSGTCLLALGPSDVASVKYLAENKAAYVITENDNLLEKLTQLFDNFELRREIEENAMALAKKNHSPYVNANFVLETLRSICDESITC